MPLLLLLLNQLYFFDVLSDLLLHPVEWLLFYILRSSHGIGPRKGEQW